jgi:Kef-type K+ transport system membrane component KefB/mannitol/fructose-specific phosphotransferase system IIA component (Ntr-type)
MNSEWLVGLGRGLRSGRARFWLIPLLFGLPGVAFAASGGGGEIPALSERMMLLVIQLGVILFAARIGGKLFERLNLPGVLGELCIGIIIGPSLLGGIPVPFLNGLEQGIFHVAAALGSGATPVSPELYGICTLASVVLLFMVGLETDLNLLVRYALAGGLVGLGGVVASFAIGDLMGVYMLPFIMEGSFTFLHPACIFLGVMSTATSVSITARILSEKRKLDTPEGVTIIAGAVFDDVLGIVMLAIGMGVIGVSGSGGSIDWGHIGYIAVKSLGIWLGATVVGVIFARRIGAALKSVGEKTEIAIMALGLALIVSGLFEEAQLAMIIGAYVLGLALSRTDISQVIREHLHPLYLFMVPCFFVVMGMMVNIKQLCEPRVLIFGLIYTAGAILAKMVGCGLPTFLCHFNLRGALRVGLGMVPRGEVALIVAGIGISRGMITQEVFGVSILMTLLTTLIPPPLLVKAFKSSASGLRKGAPLPPASPVVTYRFPSPEVTALLLNHLLEQFRKEGFFVHMLDLSGGTYQMRKDAMVINLVLEDQTITFRCSAGEIPFVRMAMTEVVVEIELTLKELQRPLGAHQLLQVPQEEEIRMSRNARMRRYINVNTLIPELKGATKADVIAELVHVLAVQGLVRDEAEALSAVLRREEAMSTGLRHGLACPHGRTSAVDNLVCAIALKPDGLPFESIDNEPTRLILLVLSPVGAVTPYMELMASMNSVFGDDGREALLACRTPQEMHTVVIKRLG